MHNYRLSPLAKRDIYEIWDYIARDSPEAADRLVDSLYKKFQLIARNKTIGSDRSSIKLGLRMLPHDSYLIFYIPSESSVKIARVLHSARNIPEIIENDLLN